MPRAGRKVLVARPLIGTGKERLKSTSDSDGRRLLDFFFLNHR